AISRPIVRAHQEHLRRLDQQRAKVLAAALGDAPEDRTAAGAVLSRHQTEPGTEIAPTLKSLAAANRGDKPGRDHWPDARHAHQPLAFSLDAAEFFDLAGDGVNALVQVTPIFVKIEDQPGHARRYLVLDRRCPAGDQSGPDAVTRLEVELVLALL